MKRLFDITTALLALLLLCLPLLALTLLVRRKLGHPAFFRQVRPGLHGQPFEMVNFRSMTDARGPGGALLPDADRLTSFGRFLRASSLDELPGLWNVFKGDMSLVGPRPLLMEYLPLYSSEQTRRHAVRPGITGWAQVNGRNALGWDDKFKLDVWYVDHPLAVARHQNSVAHGGKGAGARWHQRGGRGDDASVHREQVNGAGAVSPAQGAE